MDSCIHGRAGFWGRGNFFHLRSDLIKLLIKVSILDILRKFCFNGIFGLLVIFSTLKSRFHNINCLSWPQAAKNDGYKLYWGQLERFMLWNRDFQIEKITNKPKISLKQKFLRMSKIEKNVENSRAPTTNPKDTEEQKSLLIHLCSCPWVA